MSNPVLVHVLITGICYLAPMSNDSVLSVVMPDASIPRAPKCTGASLPASQWPPAHYAFIEVLRAQVKDNKTGITPITVGKYNVYLLSHQRITLEYNRDATKPKRLAWPSAPSTAEPFSALVNLQGEACPSCPPLDKKYVAVDASSKPYVAARIDFDDGSVVASELSPDRWYFGDPKNARYLPEQAEVDIETTDGDLTLRLDDLTDNTTPHYLVLTGTGAQVSVLVGNTTLDNLNGNGHKMSPDYHFDRFFDLIPPSGQCWVPSIATKARSRTAKAASKHGSSRPTRVGFDKFPHGADCPPAVVSVQ